MRTERQWVIQEHSNGMAVREFLKQEARFSRQFFKKVKESGAVYLDGKQVRLHKSLETGGKLKVIFPEERRSARILPEDLPLSIIYEDEDFIVVNKQAGIAVSPSVQHPSGTIANGLAYYYDQHNISSAVHIVTRLDRDTSGLMVVSKHQYGHALLSEHTDLKRQYVALAEGMFSEESGRISAPIGRKRGSIIEREVQPEGRPAETDYRIIQTGKDRTLVELSLLTGRTHQIRVHMSHIGHPLFGDTLYGGKPSPWLTGQALHCCRVDFKHPFTSEFLTFSLPIPDNWQY
ncbi:RluA family pseudouridine synthase [Halobacillus rhizosphaerae]|uniref:RluA family pseudouridine synthase n=1 Tax=Halobacillus rhizosphaerae TaxID=3064889 RepID=UPI00398AF3E2